MLFVWFLARRRFCDNSRLLSRYQCSRCTIWMQLNSPSHQTHWWIIDCCATDHKSNQTTTCYPVQCLSAVLRLIPVGITHSRVSIKNWKNTLMTGCWSNIQDFKQSRSYGCYADLIIDISQNVIPQPTPSPDRWPLSRIVGYYRLAVDRYRTEVSKL